MMEIVSAAEFDRHPKIRKILSRRQAGDAKIQRAVEKILHRVRREGDSALRDLTEQLDGVRLRSLRIPAAEIRKQAGRAPRRLRKAIAAARRRIEDFHRNQIEKSWRVELGAGAWVGQRIAPLSSVGIYIPGGTAAYPSTVLMNAVPAQVAGVKRIAAVTPPRTFQSSPAVAAALCELGLDEVYAVGGAQAIAALAYGTRSILKVDKIVGPGNQYVAAAKRMVFGAVDIDMIAGPTEVVIVADERANARWVAADLLAQAEHDPQASAICITNSERLAHLVQQQVEELMWNLERRLICRDSIDAFGVVIVIHNLSEAETLVHRLAPEHLELHLSDAEPFSRKIKNAGAIFIGSYSPEATGDYVAGPNHVLPTNGTGQFSSPLGVYDFVKRTSLIRYSKERLQKDAALVAALARSEQLTAHAQSVEIRMPSRSFKHTRRRQ